MTALLSVRGLRVTYPARRAGRRHPVTVIADLDLDVVRGETLAVVGESGTGKSTLADAILGLVRPSAGSINYDGAELVGLRGRAARRARVKIQSVAQNPLLALSPACRWEPRSRSRCGSTPASAGPSAGSGPTR